MEWLARLYAKRIVNVNVNILVAGGLAIGIMYFVMHWIHVLEIDAHIADKTRIKVEFVNMGLSFVIDLVADLAVYYVLHWYANHVPSRYGGKLLHPEYSDLSFMQDATKVQVERMLLAPILYLIAMGLQYYMQKEGVRPPAAAAIGFTAGICTTRTIHTLFMLWEQRRRRRGTLTLGAREPVAGRAPVGEGEGDASKPVKQAS
jgi:hypothetical protein